MFHWMTRNAVNRVSLVEPGFSVERRSASQGSRLRRSFCYLLADHSWLGRVDVGIGRVRAIALAAAGRPSRPSSDGSAPHRG